MSAALAILESEAFQRRAAPVEAKVRAASVRDEIVSLGEIAAELEVSLDIAGVWVALLAVDMGVVLEITAEELPQ